MSKPKRRIMRNFRLDEISAVDMPAQTGAVMTLMKKQVRKAIGEHKFLAKDFAYVGDPNDIDTWKYRLTDKPGAKPSKKRLDQVIKAVAGMMNGQMASQMPMAAQRYHIPEDAIESVLDKLREAWTMAYGGGAGSQPMPEELDPAAAEEETDDAAAIDAGIDDEVDPEAADEEAIDEEAAAEDEETAGGEDAAATAAAAAAAATEAAGAAKPKPKKKPPPAKKQSLAERIGKRYIDPMDGAKTFTEVLDCYEQDRKYSEVMEVAWPLVSALDTSLRSVVADRELDVAAKHASMRSSIEGFLALMREAMPEVEEVLEKALSAVEKEEHNMTTAKGTAGGASSQKNDDLKSQVEALTKSAAEDKARAEKAEAELATLKAVAALNGDEKEHYDRLKDDVTKAAFLGMDKTARFAEIKKALSGDETVIVAGQSISKSAVGDTLFAVFKAQAAQQVALEKQLADERVARQDAELSKRVDTELAGLVGTPEEKRELLKALDGMPEAQREYAKKVFSAASKTAGLAFDRLGSGAPMHTIKKADGSGFEKRVQEVLKRDNSTRQDAIRTARSEYPEEFAAWQGGAN